jgi:hypothetical protein
MSNGVAISVSFSRGHVAHNHHTTLR